MPRRPRSKAAASPLPSKVIACVSDVHFDIHDVKAWAAFRQWHALVRPDILVMNGDMIDLGMLSHYPQEEDAPLFAIEQIKTFVHEANELREECGRLIFMEGNHEARWTRIVGAAPAGALRGALGLDLQAQCRAHGLRDDVEWNRESTKNRGIQFGQFLFRHGHKQAGKHGGAKHLTANRLTKSMGVSESFGHHHRAAITCQTSHGRTAIAVANPCMVSMQEYNPDGDCQEGFSIYELAAPDYKVATPHLIVMLDGRFSWGGLTFDGNA